MSPAWSNSLLPGEVGCRGRLCAYLLVSLVFGLFLTGCGGGGGASVQSPPVISSSSLPQGSVQTAYWATLVASGGEAPYNWSVVQGSLPSGLKSGQWDGHDRRHADRSRHITVHSAGSRLSSEPGCRAGESQHHYPQLPMVTQRNCPRVLPARLIRPRCLSAVEFLRTPAAWLPEACRSG